MERTIKVEILWALATKWERDVEEARKPDLSGEPAAAIAKAIGDGATEMKQKLAGELRDLVALLG